MHLPASMFPNKLAPEVPNNIPKNPRFYSFVFCSIVLVTPFNKISESSRALTIFIISFISLFEIISVVILERCIFFSIPSFISAVTPNGARIFFANGTATFVNRPLSYFRYLRFRQLLYQLLYCSQMHFLISFFALLLIINHEPIFPHQTFYYLFSALVLFDF